MALLKALQKIAKKASISFVMSVFLSACLSVRMGQLSCHWTGFYGI
jgi:hypothetical protein